MSRGLMLEGEGPGSEASYLSSLSFMQERRETRRTTMSSSKPPPDSSTRDHSSSFLLGQRAESTFMHTVLKARESW